MKALFVIEGKAKVGAMHAALARIHRSFNITSFEIVATKGHVARQHGSLDVLRLSTEWEELGYETDPGRHAELEQIRSAAARADRVYLACDDDQEGDVIARDVQRFALNGVPALRCRLRAIDSTALRQSLERAVAFDPSAAVKGDARRIVDRAVGSAFSDVSAPGNKRPVGRVFSSALAALPQSPVVLGTARVTVPCDDGGRPFAGLIPFTRVTNLEALLLAPGRAARALPQAADSPHGPMNYADVVVCASERLGLSLREASHGLQTAYEEGLVSYPRASARAISGDGLSVCKALAERNGATFIEAGVARFGESSDGSHEAPRLLDTIDLCNLRGDVPLSRRIAVLIGRHLVECGQRRRVEKPDPDSLPPQLRLFSEHLSRTEVEGWMPWKPPLRNDAVRRHTKEVAILRALELHRLGRPSTWVDHVEKLVRRSVFTDDMLLTKRGAELLALAARNGIDARFSSVVEEVIDRATTETAGLLARHAVASASSEAYALISSAIERDLEQRLEA